MSKKKVESRVEYIGSVYMFKVRANTVNGSFQFGILMPDGLKTFAHIYV